jgi:1,4-dihydroxy-6-naphthoate synthase
MTKTPISVIHSPDADDRFMFWPLRSGRIPCASFDFRFEEADTQTLNQRALEGSADIIAVSAAHYPNIADRYQPLRMGASVGAGYGPVLVTREASAEPEAFRGGADWLLLSPGHQTTAHQALAALGYSFGSTEVVPIAPMSQVFERLHAFDPSAKVAALLIHEGRLLYEGYGARRLVDLGEAWQRAWGCHLPLGINVIRRSIPEDLRRELSELLRSSCQHAQAHRTEFASMTALKGELTTQQIEHYLDLYANETTLDISVGDRLAFEHLVRTVASSRGAGTPVATDWV